jgi:hypothetical protein
MKNNNGVREWVTNGKGKSHEEVKYIFLVSKYSAYNKKHTLTLEAEAHLIAFKYSVSTAGKTQTFLCYKDQLVNFARGNNRCLFLESYGVHKYIQWAKYRVTSC